MYVCVNILHEFIYNDDERNESLFLTKIFTLFTQSPKSTEVDGYIRKR